MSTVADVVGSERDREVLVQWEQRLRLVGDHDSGGAPCFDLEVLDGEDRVADSTRFGSDEFPLAAREYNRRTVESLEAPIASVVDVGLRLVNAAATLDLRAMEALLHDTFVAIDHRPIGYPDLDKAGYLGAVSAQSDAIQIWLGQTLHAATSAGWLMSGGLWTPSFGEWRPYERGIYLNVIVDDRLARLELYPDDQLDAALSRFAELTT